MAGGGPGDHDACRAGGAGAGRPQVHRGGARPRAPVRGCRRLAGERVVRQQLTGPSPCSRRPGPTTPDQREPVGSALRVVTAAGLQVEVPGWPATSWPPTCSAPACCWRRRGRPRRAGSCTCPPTRCTGCCSSPDSIPARHARARARTSRRRNRPATSANASSSPASSRDASPSSTLASAATLEPSVPTHLKHPSGGRPSTRADSYALACPDPGEAPIV